MVLRLISIHALREEGDHITSTVKYTAAQISIHALREEGDLFRLFRSLKMFLFLSTPSARRATPTVQCSRCVASISIHASREEGDVDGRIVHVLVSISIHALREEGDASCQLLIVPLYLFLSTPSARRATTMYQRKTPKQEFLSTPSARRATSPPFYVNLPFPYFYPRPPRGGRHSAVHRIALPAEFLSTPSARRATGNKSIRSDVEVISIHALREEGDSKNRDKISIFL